MANLLENSFGVRAGTGSVNAILEVEALASGRAQIQLKQNGIIRYTLGTDGTNATGSGDTNENLVLNVTRDDRSLYQLLKWFRATKTGYLIGSWCFGAAADRIGFYNANPVVKPTVTGAKGSNAALASLLQRTRCPRPNHQLDNSLTTARRKAALQRSPALLTFAIAGLS